MTNIDDLIREARDIEDTRNAWAELDWDDEAAPADQEREALDDRAIQLVRTFAELDVAEPLTIVDCEGDTWRRVGPDSYVLSIIQGREVGAATILRDSAGKTHNLALIRRAYGIQSSR